MPISKEVLSKYKADIFIETGSYLGDTIQLASEIGFKEIYSIEASDKFYTHCLHRFINNSNVFGIYKGESVEILKNLIPSIKNSSITFWLDAHYSCGETYQGDPYNLLKELEVIIKAGIECTILIAIS